MAMSPNTDNYSILQGELFFKPKGATAYQHMGNAPAFSLTPELEKLEHFSSMGGLRELDKEITRQVGAAVAITLDEITAQNLRLALMGEVTSFVQSAATAQVKNIAAVEVGGAYDLGVVGTTITSITDGSDPAVAYVAGTHYRVLAEGGMVMILAKPETAGDSVTITYDVAAVTAEAQRSRIEMLKSFDIEGSFVCIGKNEIGKRFKIEVPRIQFQPGSGIEFIASGDEFAQIELTGKVLKDLNAVHPYGLVTPLN